MDDRVSKIAFEKTSRPYTYFVLRPLGRLFLHWAIRLGITPNQVTIFSIPVFVFAMSMFAFGGFGPTLIGVMFIHLGLGLDNLDGDLARETGAKSRRGEFLDSLVGYIYGVFMLPALGIGVSRGHDFGTKIIGIAFEIPPDVFLQVGLWSGIIFGMSRLLSLRHRIIFERSPRDRTGALGKISLIIADAFPFFLIAGVILKLVSIVFLIFAVFYLLSFLYVVLGSIFNVFAEEAEH